MEETTNQMPGFTNGEAPEASEKKGNTENIFKQLKAIPVKMFGKCRSLDKKTVRKYAVLLIVAVVVAAAAVFALQMLTNNYMTPVKTMEKYANMDEYSSEKAYLAYSNGLAKREWKQIYEIMHNSDAYMETKDEIEDAAVKAYEKKLNTYGDNYKIQYEVLGKLELEKSELRNHRSELQCYFDSFEDIVDSAEDFSSEDWADMAEALDLRKSEAKELVAAFRSLVETVDRVSVEKGYELEVKQIITGSELDEPEENELSYVVLKVNGRWISYVNYIKLLQGIN